MKKLLKRIFRKRKGVTILEGLISLGLLALVASGTFGVLLSISRQASSPDIREEMVWAVERAHEQLQMYAAEIQSAGGVEFSLANGLCGNASVNRVTLNVCFRLFAMLLILRLPIVLPAIRFPWRSVVMLILIRVHLLMDMKW